MITIIIKCDKCGLDNTEVFMHTSVVDVALELSRIKDLDKRQICRGCNRPPASKYFNDFQRRSNR